MSIVTKKDIIDQRNQVFEQEFQVELASSCTVGNGILRLDGVAKENARIAFEESNDKPSFFIPASGSGSRMFKFLYQWLEDGIETEDVKLFFTELPNFPFFGELAASLSDRKAIVSEVLEKFSTMPKGLIPFHRYENEVRTAFQEHLAQAKDFLGEDAQIHFTVQKEFESDISENIVEDKHVSFSYQNDETDAYCFDESGELIKEGEEYLRRPAGHGALLENLNAIDSDLVLLKNIDNIQHSSKSRTSKETWRLAIGTLLNFKKDVQKLANDFSSEKLSKLNEAYQFLSKNQLVSFKEKDLQTILNRPTRICGMVKNEGEPGGGPFWIADKQGVSNQIIEKAQIKNSKEQQVIVQRSSHFNPVFIVVSKTDVQGNKLDLMQFRDNSKFFVVKKTHKGKEIFYRELPGLWNGSMSNWNTIFLEIPSDVFTPVKSILNLLA
ncbi:MAG TPA: DUF4301 family protein [Crocinitomicaceae bacterium]|nr:DUF4301 family protein [Crocinitomicaceae bacterium]